MPPLVSNLRNILDSSVQTAREQAQTAAAAALNRLGVAGKEAPSFLVSKEEQAIRLALRAKARQLGDPWIAAERTFADLERLTHEVAYEHWHRMLFARFLAENGLLLHPEHGVSLDLTTVAQLAAEEAAGTGTMPDPWATAGRFAAGMLPQIFRPDDPALQVALAPEHQQALEKTLESLAPSVFTADDSLGWVYQFWQTAEKKRVNEGVKSGEKITGRTLPAVTQLFTEHYMVLFLLHNTVGAWWAGKQLTAEVAEIAESEQELRESLALPGVEWEYLRFVREAKEGEDLDKGTGPWRPAAGTYEGWPREAKALRVLDPCCGSGHFLVAAFELLVRLRVAEEGLAIKDAVRAVIADNLYGLELDARCTQIAAFNLAIAAWKIAGGVIELPPMHIACSGLGPNCTEKEWIALAETRMDPSRRGAFPTSPLLPPIGREPVRNGLRNLHALFSKAPELGSLIDPTKLSGDLLVADYETLLPFLSDILIEERGGDADTVERAVAAQGMAKAAEILAGGEAGYTLVITNVPYLGRGSQSDTLREFAENHHPEAKADLATVFVSRMFRWVGRREDAGTVAAITPQNWLFLTSYRKLRERLLKERSWEFVARLGPGAFETIGGHVVNVALLGISGGKAGKDHIMAGVDVSAANPAPAKAALLRGETAADAPSPPAPDDARPADGSVRLVPQAEQVKNPDARVLLHSSGVHTLLSEFAVSLQGLSPADLNRYGRNFWEGFSTRAPWKWWQTTVDANVHFGGREWSLLWDDGLDDAIQRGSAYVRGEEGWGRVGVIVNQMSDLPATLYTGDIVDTNAAAIVPKAESHLAAIWCFCSSREFAKAVRRIDQALKVTNASLVKVPFDLDHWQKVAAEKYPNGLPEPQSDDPTQWLFHGRPERAEAHAALQVGVARLVSYRWPAELDEDMRLAPEARALVRRCAELAGFADDDGVVPLNALNREKPAAERLRALLDAAFRDAGGLKLNDLLAAAGSPGKSLDDWLRHDFFAQHAKLFHNRPFIWQIWDGKKDGFSVLVNYHRLAAGDGEGRKLLEKITYTYLGDWITQQKAEAKKGTPGADTREKAATDLQAKLELILKGEPPYDLFIRWKPLHEQPIGWEPDINDGVRLNIRPFLTAGVLRSKVNIHWKKDRGKEPQSLRPREQFPWFWGWDGKTKNFEGGDGFDGVRHNDLHYTNAHKQAARAAEAAAT